MVEDGQIHPHSDLSAMAFSKANLSARADVQSGLGFRGLQSGAGGGSGVGGRRTVHKRCTRGRMLRLFSSLGQPKNTSMILIDANPSQETDEGLCGSRSAGRHSGRGGRGSSCSTRNVCLYSVCERLGL